MDALRQAPLRGVTLKPGADLHGFRAAVRRLAAAEIPPERVIWSANNEGELLGDAAPATENASAIALPRAVAALVPIVVCHHDPQRYALLCTLIWRVVRGERALLEVASDPVVHRLELMAKSVRRDLHKMHAFVRFRRTEDPDDGERYVAWFEPEHFILEATADFFVERFRGMVWSILSPLGSLHWDRESLLVGPPARKCDAPDDDAFEAAWRAYYESAFNPARTNPEAMRGHMPKKYWKNLPETRAIPELIRGAPDRVREMIEREASVPLKRDPQKAVAAMAKQAPRSLDALNALIVASEPLSPGADRAVLGEGPMRPAIAFVGEQPGDEEEKASRPFVGPAGQLLDRALREAGIARDESYLTNAVKHFKYELRGKRRLHKRPDPGEVKHYRWWLMKELDFVQPRLVVALGATAALALTGKPLAVTRQRGPASFRDWPGFVTVHPSYLLRLPDEAARTEAYAAFVADLRRAAELAA
jgi:probable DNA metabolism protein